MKSPFTLTYNPDWRKPQAAIVQQESSNLASEQILPAPSSTAVPHEVVEPSTEPVAAQEPQPTPTPGLADEQSTTIITTSADATTPSGPSRKRSKMHVTWDDERKLRKKNYPTGLMPTQAVAAPPTPDATPERTKPSFFFRFTSKQSTTYPSSTAVEPPSPPPSPPGWKHHDSYFPEYTPIYPTTTFADPFARPYILTPAEIQAQQHAARVGHAVAVHYPMLPPFNEYQSTGGKTQGAWQSGQWGNSNWTGFGLNGERLPDGEGKTFGAPMPKGVPAEGPKGAAGPAKKGKGGGGGGGEEGGAAEGEQAQAGEEAGGGAEGEGAAAPAAGDGGGGGGTSKKKKKK